MSEITWTFSSNDIADHRDLALRLALRTLLYKSFQDVDLDTVLSVIESEAETLRHKMNASTVVRQEIAHE